MLISLFAATEATRKSPRSIQLPKSITAKINLFWDYYTHITWIWGPKIRFLRMWRDQWHSLGNQANNEQICIHTWKWRVQGLTDTENCLSFLTHLSKQLLNIWKSSTRVLKFSGLNPFPKLLACMKFPSMNKWYQLTAKRHNIFTY